MDAADFDEETPEESAALDAAAAKAAGSVVADEGVDVTALAIRQQLARTRESVDSSRDRQIVDGLRPIADGLISVVVAGEYLVGNFGDWADDGSWDTFKAVAESVGLVPEGVDEAGDLLSIEKYKDGYELELDVPPTLTQESLKGWSNYP